MIGERLESRPSRFVLALVFLAIALGLLGGAFLSGIKALGVAAILPIALAGSVWILGRERPFAARCHHDGLEVENVQGNPFIPYASIQNIKVGNNLADPSEFRKTSCSIAVLHEAGLLRLPARLNVPSDEVFRFLVERVPRCGGRALSPVVTEYLETQERRFGRDAVVTFSASRRRIGPARTDNRAFCIGLTVAGAVWIALGAFQLSETAWAAAGIFCVGLGAVLYAATYTESFARGTTQSWRNASLVVGPEGMAMVQGNIQGVLRWPELLDVRFNAKPLSFKFTSQGVIPGVELRVAGATIVIGDVYDRPLYVIYDQIRSRWRNSARPAADDRGMA